MMEETKEEVSLSRLGTISPNTPFSPERAAVSRFDYESSNEKTASLLELDNSCASPNNNPFNLTFYNPSLAGETRKRLLDRSGGSPSSSCTTPVQAKKRRELSLSNDHHLVLSVSPRTFSCLQATPQAGDNCSKSTAGRTSPTQTSCSPNLPNRQIHHSKSTNNDSQSSTGSQFSPQTSNRESQFGCSSVICKGESPDNHSKDENNSSDASPDGASINTTFFNPSLVGDLYKRHKLGED